MEAHYRTRNGRLTIAIEANSQKDLFKALATVAEVFEAESTCGCCNSDLIRFQVRTVETFDHFELQCANCTARFEFGQHRNGQSLFPKRRDENGNSLPNRGWKIWKGENV
jgi:hypothetical protein